MKCSSSSVCGVGWVQGIRQQKLKLLEQAGVPVKYQAELARKNFVAVK
jgi:hypothetical protein